MGNSQKCLSVICYFLLILFFIPQLSCNTTEPPDPKPDPALNLELEDVSCTEAWIQLTTKDLTLPAELTLKQYNPTGDSISKALLLNTQDTLLYIDSLLPNQTYNFKLSGIGNPVVSGILSNELSVTTMDTTSHDFTWETFTFGGTAGSSSLYDVAIINENNIWAVGEILIADSSPNGYTMYNAVHWDGNKWNLKKITVDFRGFLITPALEGIFAFSPTQIWLAGGLTIFGDGTNWTPYDIRLITGIDGLSASKIWGSSPDNMYFVGRNGNIAHYNGSQWRKIESGTNLNINDIWGDYNEKTGEWEILAVASNKFFNEGNSLLKIKGLATIQLNTAGLPWSLSSIWHIANKKYFIGGDGLFFNKILNENWNKDTMFIPIYKDRIRGININEIVVSGSNGLLSHHNGFNWKHYINNELPYYSGRLLSVDIKNDIIIAVGWKNTQSVITIGLR